MEKYAYLCTYQSYNSLYICIQGNGECLSQAFALFFLSIRYYYPVLNNIARRKKIILRANRNCLK